MSRNMTKLTRAKALGMIAAGISNPDIANELGVDQGRNLEAKKRKEALRKEVAVKGNWKHVWQGEAEGAWGNKVVEEGSWGEPLPLG